MTRTLLFASREQHVSPIEVRFHRARIELQSFIEGSPSLQKVHLSTQPVPDILQMRYSQPRPRRCVVLMPFHYTVEQLTCSIEIIPAARTRYKCGKDGPSLQVLLRNI